MGVERALFEGTMAKGSWVPVELTVLELYPSPDGVRVVLRYVVDGAEHLVSRRKREQPWVEGQRLRGVYWSEDPSALGHELAPAD